MYESISAQTDAIGDQVEVLKSKLEEAKSRQAMLIARSQMADTQKSLAKAAGSFDPNSSFDKFQRMEDKADAMLDVAAAEAELNATAASNEVDSLASKYDASPDAAVQDELAALKAKMGVTSAE